VMYLQGLVLAYMAFRVVKSLFFGPLRAAETEVNSPPPPYMNIVPCSISRSARGTR
jgi:hypothetical protein